LQLTQYALRNTHFTSLLFLLLTLFGVTGILAMPRAEDPYIEQPLAVISILLPGASAAELETLIAKPLEERLHEVPELHHIESHLEDGLVRTIVDWGSAEDRSEVKQRIAQAINDAQRGFPEGVRQVDFFAYSTHDVVRVLQLALVSSRASPDELRELAEDLSRELRRVSGIKSVEVEGARAGAVVVDVSSQQVARHGLGISSVIDSIHDWGAGDPSGAIRIGERKFNVKTTAPYESLEELRSVPVEVSAQGVLRVRDVAEISFGHVEPLYLTRLNGEPCVFVTLRQNPDVDLLRLRERVEHVVSDFRAELPERVRLESVFDQSRFVRQRIDHFLSNLLQGMLLVGLVTLVSLGMRASFIIMTAIPGSFLIALGIAHALGYALQQMTIVALVIALGLLVDNAIVVTEIVTRFVQSAGNRVEATSRAMAQVGWGLVSSTATTALAFLPIVLMQDVAGDYIRSMPMTVILCLGASLLIALTLTPLMALRLAKQNAKSYSAMRLLEWISEAVYLPSLRLALNHPFCTLAGVTLLFFASLALFPAIGVSYFPRADRPQLLIDVELPYGSTLDTTDQMVRQVEARLLSSEQVERVATNVGRGNPSIYYNMLRQASRPHIAQLLVGLRSEGAPDPAFTEALRDELHRIPGARFAIREFQQGRRSDAPVIVRLQGDDLDVLRRVSIELEGELRSVPGIVHVSNPIALQATDMHLDIDPVEAGLRGVSTREVSRVLRSALSGYPASVYRRRDGTELPVFVHLDRARPDHTEPPRAQGEGDSEPTLRLASMQSRPRYDKLQSLNVRAQSGAQVPVLQLARPVFQPTQSVIQRRDLTRMVAIAADVSGVRTSKVVAELQVRLDNVKLPPGFTASIGGESETRGDSFSSMYQATIMAIVGIFAVLVLQFRSYAQPFIILSSVPLGIIGVLTGLWVSGNSFSFTAFVGLTSLVGIVVNNGILLVDHINQKRALARPLDVAIFAGARMRFIPIVLTSVTTLLGVLPLATSGSEFWAPMGWALMGGLLLSTVLTLIVTPTLYAVLARRAGAQLNH